CNTFLYRFCILTNHKGSQMPTLIHQNISPRTGEVLVCAAQGMSIKMTARAMGCAISTVESLRSNAMYKLHANNMVSAVAEAMRRGVLAYVALVVCVLTAMGLVEQMRPYRSPIRPAAVVRMATRWAL